jgi:hypothetical protein
MRACGEMAAFYATACSASEDLIRNCGRRCGIQVTVQHVKGLRVVVLTLERRHSEISPKRSCE